MSDDSKIEWTDATWPITVGCTRTAPAGSVQSGCGDASGGGCYAEQSVARVNRCSIGAGRPAPYADLVKLVKRGDRTVARWTGRAKFFPERLAMPLRWERPRRIFVSSQSDLFHDDVTNEQIAAVFGVMAAAPQHTFQVLTKRARRMREWFEWAGRLDLDRLQARAYSAIPESDHAGRLAIARGRGRSWPLRNVWLGVSVENQAAADERIPELLATPAAVRWISAEPLIGAVDLGLPRTWLVGATARKILRDTGARGAVPAHLQPPPSLDWFVMGAESGPGARAADPAWFRGLAEQCRSAGVPVFFKQGVVGGGITAGPESHAKHGGLVGLPLLDGASLMEFPR